MNNTDSNTTDYRFTKASELTNSADSDTDFSGYQIPLSDTGEDADDQPDYTEHVEPPEQGGEPYVRCTECRREFLTKFGGRDKFPHKLDCSLGGDA